MPPLSVGELVGEQVALVHQVVDVSPAIVLALIAWLSCAIVDAVVLIS